MTHHMNRDRETHKIMLLLEHTHGLLHLAIERLDRMSAELDRLTASVDALTASEKKLVALVGSLAQQIRDNATDPAALTALADKIDADTAEITKAVDDNTPAAPVETAPVDETPAAPVDADPSAQ